MNLTPATCRAARALLGINQADLARMSGVSPRTVAGFEGGGTKTISANLQMLRTALERAGVEFLDGDGVRFRQTADASP